MSLKPRLNKFPSLGPHGFHRLSYVEWGEADNPHVVICAHGLTRNARDFDELARALALDCRVVCLDVAGRGGSDWLEHKEDYGFSLYVADAAALIARVASAPAGAKARRFFTAPKPRARPAIDWIGTSMGGLIGMMLASKPRSPIRRLVLNDIGAMVPWAPPSASNPWRGQSPFRKLGRCRKASAAHLRVLRPAGGRAMDGSRKPWRKAASRRRLQPRF
jgi:pimeloyl-ACP methyl ester carboxylesterase